MPPARGDHAARRNDVSAAVWRVLAERGFSGLTLRAVAAELGASTGLLTHYFPNKRALLSYALELLDRDARGRLPAAGAPGDGSSGAEASGDGSSGAEASGDGSSAAGAEGMARLREVLLDILPTTPESVAGNRIWVSSWDTALADPELAAQHAERYRKARERNTALVEAAQRAGEVSAERPATEVAAGVQAFALGLVVQALLSPEEFPAERQTALLEGYLDTL
ncbi:TetR/AcrR family transcriptional regulator [Kitasatospora sp. NPDC051853]|uniref:TetR/AcrR family transcriptional regulator n=1 Tax=Kitasatospora sp. NPDC051853 TaxID=3364058 RepID=UPI0037B202EB